MAETDLRLEVINSGLVTLQDLYDLTEDIVPERKVKRTLQKLPPQSVEEKIIESWVEYQDISKVASIFSMSSIEIDRLLKQNGLL